ncbi:MAG: S8 family serine peptidase [Nanoarchaeota archaeon]
MHFFRNGNLVFLVALLLLASFIGVGYVSSFEVTEYTTGIETLTVNNPRGISITGETSMDYVPGELIVKFKKGVDPAGHIGASKFWGGISGFFGGKNFGTELNRMDVNFVKKVIDNAKSDPDFENLNLGNIVKLSFDENLDPEEVARILKELSSDIEYAGPNHLMQPLYDPNDPYWGTSGAWGQAYLDLYGLDSIQTSSAWEITQGEDVVVAVIDSGVDYIHEDLQANIWNNPGEIPNNNIDDDDNGLIDDIVGWDFNANDNDPDDFLGHGTHCAGIIAAVINNNLGVAGVAPRAKIMAIKGLGPTGGREDALINALHYAAEMGADVISNSWGGQADPATSPLCDAVTYARNRGSVVIASAGNDDSNVNDFIIAGCDGSIGVAAVDWNDEKASFSNWGTGIDVTAPGVNILSLRGKDTDMYGDGLHIIPQGDSQGKYYVASGTSMSGPYAAGVTALIKALNPTYNVAQVENVLMSSADDLGDPGYDIYYGWGRINAVNAVGLAGFDLKINPQYLPVPNRVDVYGTAIGSLDRWEVYYYPEGNPAGRVDLNSGTSEINNQFVGSVNAAIMGFKDYYFKLTITETGTGRELTATRVFSDHYSIQVYNEISSDGKTVNIYGTLLSPTPTLSWSLDYYAESDPDTVFHLSDGISEFTDQQLGQINREDLGFDNYYFVLTANDNIGNEISRATFFDNHFKYVFGSGITSSITPLLVDINDDNEQEIFAIANPYDLTVVGHDLPTGQFIGNFPVTILDGVADPKFDDDNWCFMPGTHGWAWFTSGISLGTLDSDGLENDIVVGGATTVAAMDQQGNLKWKRAFYELVDRDPPAIDWPACLMYSRPVLADFDNDGLDEIVVNVQFRQWLQGATERPFPKRNYLVVYDSNGNELYNYRLPGDETLYGDGLCVQNLNGLPTPSEPVASDIDDDGVPEILLVTGNFLYAWEFDGSTGYLKDDISLGLFLGYGTKSCRAPLIVDIDANGQTDILLGDIGSQIFDFIWDSNANQLVQKWKKTPLFINSLIRPTFAGHLLTAADFENDGQLEIMIPPINPITSPSLTRMMVLDSSGNIKNQFDLPCGGDPCYGSTSRGAVYAGDFDEDGTQEMAIINGFGVARIYLKEVSGADMGNWPIEAPVSQGFEYEHPILGEIDGDVNLDLIFASRTGHIRVTNVIDNANPAEYNPTEIDFAQHKYNLIGTNEFLSTCTNGIQDGLETGIDCGNICGKVCPGEVYQFCITEDDCPLGGYACCNNMCIIPECDNDDDCGIGEVCESPGNCNAYCESLSGCNFDSDCIGLGELCCGNLCMVPECANDQQCDTLAQQNGQRGWCENDNTCNSFCQFVECLPGNYQGECGTQICCSQLCVDPACSIDTDCPIGQYCQGDGTCNAQCLTGCIDDSNCGAGTICCNNQCAIPICSSNNDCDVGESCVNPGTCNAICESASCIGQVGNPDTAPELWWGLLKLSQTICVPTPLDLPQTIVGFETGCGFSYPDPPSYPSEIPLSCPSGTEGDPGGGPCSSICDAYGPRDCRNHCGSQMSDLDAVRYQAYSLALLFPGFECDVYESIISDLYYNQIDDDCTGEGNSCCGIECSQTCARDYDCYTTMPGAVCDSGLDEKYYTTCDNFCNTGGGCVTDDQCPGSINFCCEDVCVQSCIQNSDCSSDFGFCNPGNDGQLPTACDNFCEIVECQHDGDDPENTAESIWYGMINLAQEECENSPVTLPQEVFDFEAGCPLVNYGPAESVPSPIPPSCPDEYSNDPGGLPCTDQCDAYGPRDCRNHCGSQMSDKDAARYVSYLLSPSLVPFQCEAYKSIVDQLFEALELSGGCPGDENFCCGTLPDSQCVISCLNDLHCFGGDICYPGLDGNMLTGCDNACISGGPCGGNTCTVGELCCNDVCTIPECSTDIECPTDQYCINDGTCAADCVPGCNTNVNCATGKECCSNMCTTVECDEHSDCPDGVDGAGYCNYGDGDPDTLCDNSCEFADCIDDPDCGISLLDECCGTLPNTICFKTCYIDNDCSYLDGPDTVGYCNPGDGDYLSTPCDNVCEVKECFFNNDCQQGNDWLCCGPYPNGACEQKCMQDTDCPTGEYCVNDGTCNAVCQIGCDSSVNCGAGQDCCGNLCTDTECLLDSDCQLPGSVGQCNLGGIGGCDNQCEFFECLIDTDCIDGFCCGNTCEIQDGQGRLLCDGDEDCPDDPGGQIGVCNPGDLIGNCDNFCELSDCTGDADCINPDEYCCGGLCREYACDNDAECDNPPVERGYCDNPASCSATCVPVDCFSNDYQGECGTQICCSDVCEDPLCSTDTDCPVKGEYCVNDGTCTADCVSGCETSVNCNTGQECCSGSCADVYCSNDNDCPDDEGVGYCNPGDGDLGTICDNTCDVKDCFGDLDCTGSDYCCGDYPDGVCEFRCTEDADCPDGSGAGYCNPGINGISFICDNVCEVKECLVNDDCSGADNFCCGTHPNGVCTQTCSQNSDCDYLDDPANNKVGYCNPSDDYLETGCDNFCEAVDECATSDDCTDQICCDSGCIDSVCSANNDCAITGLAGTCNEPDTCTASCSYVCDEINYFDCIDSAPFCSTLLEPVPPVDECCQGAGDNQDENPCWQCDIGDPLADPPVAPEQIVCATDDGCAGHQTCVDAEGIGIWDACVKDDPSCPVSAPPSGGGGSGGGGGGGGGGGIVTPRECVSGRIETCGTSDKGKCKLGTRECVKSFWTECVGNVEPKEEVCNAVDDDCDDIIDNLEIDSVTFASDVTLSSISLTKCRCYNGEEPMEEICNGIDDDCNEAIDDFADCCIPGSERDCGPQEAGIGVCTNGVSTCNDEYLWGDCEGAVYPSIDILNLVDDDCDGEIIDFDVVQTIQQNITAIIFSLAGIIILISTFIAWRKGKFQESLKSSGRGPPSQKEAPQKP